MVNLSTELYNLFDSDGSHIVRFLEWLVEEYGHDGIVDVLDVGCGPGRTLRPMAELGWRVVAMEPNVDYHASAVEVSQRLENVTVIGGGFSEIEQESAYDLIAAINAPYAHLRTIEERIDALSRIYRALKPGGVVLIDIPNFIGILKSHQNPQSTQTQSPTGDLVRRVVEHDIDVHDGSFTHTDLFFVNDKQLDKQVHRMSIITLPEIEFFLKQAGFEDMMTFNGFAARESQRISGVRLMISARKPADD